ncbi:PadR family transcriptional regulator [Micromonospora sp. CPCC 205371]|nr:PadR family transcriptional regulator [Micromonospora sp. CPCC 205371]
MPRTPNSSPQTLSVLAALLAEPSRWRHGYELSKETGLASGSLYPILMRLTQQGMLEAEWQSPVAPGRPARHAYRLTSGGVALARTRLAERDRHSAPAQARPAMRVAW